MKRFKKGELVWGICRKPVHEPWTGVCQIIAHTKGRTDLLVLTGSYKGTIRALKWKELPDLIMKLPPLVAILYGVEE